MCADKEQYSGDIRQGRIVNGTGSATELWPGDPALDGQSMVYYYNWLGVLPFSEVWADVCDLPSETGSDWRTSGFEALVLYFYGRDFNKDVNQIQTYVKLSDGAGNESKVIYDGDINDVGEEEWHEWSIALQDFVDDNDVNLADVNRITIGIEHLENQFGDVYFDDILLRLLEDP